MQLRHYILFAVLVLLLSSCSKGTLDFIIESPENNAAPTSYTFINKSEGFDTYWWDFGDKELVSDSIVNRSFYLSGNYEVTLKGLKGTKVKELAKRVVVSAPEACLILIETDMGDMLIELSDATPAHRDNFIKLAEEGFYEDLLFHRVIDGFMVQGGDPKSRGADKDKVLGSGGPGYTIDAEIRPNLAHVKGALAAARQGDAVNPQKKSSGSQFYIVHGRAVSEGQLTQNEYRYDISYTDEVKKQYLENGGTPFLDQQYTVFGQVVQGMEVIDAIAKSQTNRGDRPVEDVLMRIKVIK